MARGSGRTGGRGFASKPREWVKQQARKGGLASGRARARNNQQDEG